MGGLYFSIPKAPDYECYDKAASPVMWIISNILKIMDPSDPKIIEYKNHFYDPYCEMIERQNEEDKKREQEGVEPSDVTTIPLKLLPHALPALEIYYEHLSNLREWADKLRREKGLSGRVRYNDFLDDENIAIGLENSCDYGAEAFIEAIKVAIEHDSDLIIYYS